MYQNYLHSMSFSFSSSFSSKMLMLFLLFSLFTSIIEGNLKVPAIFTFGDSFADQGNNDYLLTISRADHLPYGKDFIGGNHPTGRFGNGKVFADLFAEALGIKEFVPPYLNRNLPPFELLTGVSFGSAASGYDPQTTAGKTVLSMKRQMELFKEYIAELRGDDAEHVLSNGVFLVIAGIGDLANTYFTFAKRRLQYNVDSYTSFLVEIASQFVKDLHLLGARRIFTFGLPPIGCLPLAITLKGGILRNCSIKENEAAKLYNMKLLNALSTINKTLSTIDDKTNVAYVDFYNPLNNLIRYPKENGFTVVDRGCCGTGYFELGVSCEPETPICDDDMAYLFWDSIHPTEHGFTLLVDQMLKNSFSSFM